MRKNKNRGYQKLRVWNDLAHLVSQFQGFIPIGNRNR